MNENTSPTIRIPVRTRISKANVLSFLEVDSIHYGWCVAAVADKSLTADQVLNSRRFLFDNAAWLSGGFIRTDPALGGYLSRTVASDVVKFSCAHPSAVPDQSPHCH